MQRLRVEALEPWWRVRWVGAVVLAVVLVGLSFLTDTSGYLGTDTGGKTATLEAMVRRGDWSVDVGYWAEEFDPDGVHHPLYGTGRSDEGWVQVTSLPMIFAARPLYELGGYRLALVLPIAGAVAVALAAAALVHRVGGSRSDADRAFWVFGLASPAVVYALDLWEHSLGLAAMAWSAVLLVGAVLGDRSVASAGRAAGAGALLALAATMRTEALVYTLVLVGGASAWTMVRRGVVAATSMGASAVLGFVPVWLLNAALEAWAGGLSRTSRATGAAGSVGSELGVRLEEGLRTTFAVAATEGWSAVAIGAVLAAVIAVLTARGTSLDPPAQRVAIVMLVGLGLLPILQGLGFVPGLLAAFPVAAAGLALKALPVPARLVAVGAIVSLPIVWAFQFIGGAGPQWGGRYVLASGFLLGVAGIVALGARTAPRQVLVAVVSLSATITAFGVAWLHQRTHEVAELFGEVAALESEALIARNPFFLREAGPMFLGRRWLSATDPGNLDSPAAVLRNAGIDDFSVLQLATDPRPAIVGTTVLDASTVGALGVEFEVVRLRFDG